MKKTLLKGLALALVGTALAAGQAMALPMPGQGYSWVNAPYWTNNNGKSTFSIRVENAAYESAFGLFVNNGGNIDKFQVLAPSQEIGAKANVYFRLSGGEWQVSLKKKKNYVSFDNVFGFYFDVVDTGASYYSDSRLDNPGDASYKHVLTSFKAKGAGNARIFLEDLASNAPSDWDYDDMVVSGKHIAPAPVPEPASLLLMGSGLIGITSIARRRRLKRD